jgi:hypothetical protein
MVAIAEKQKITHFSNTNLSEEIFYEDMDSTETLLNDWKLIQEAEKDYDPNNCMSAKEAYLKIKKYINNLK